MTFTLVYDKYWLAKPYHMNSNVPINIKGARPYFRAMVAVNSTIWLFMAPFLCCERKVEKKLLIPLILF